MKTKISVKSIFGVQGNIVFDHTLELEASDDTLNVSIDFINLEVEAIYENNYIPRSSFENT